MVLDKALLLKGLAGVAAVGGTVGGGIVYKSLSSSKKEAEGKEEDTKAQGGKTPPTATDQTKQSNPSATEEQNQQPAKPAANTAAPQSTHTTDNQQPDGSSGSQTPTVTGRENAASVQPGVAGTGAPQSVDHSYSSQVKTDEEKKTAKKKEVNEKLKTLGIEGCDLDDNNISSPTAYSKECALDQAKFKKIRFSNSENSNDVTVEGWTSGKTVTLRLENKEGDKTKFTFKDVKDNLTIVGAKGEGIITLPQDSEKEFEEKESKLSKVSVDASETSKKKAINGKLKALKFPDRCWFDEAEKDDFTECSLSNVEELKKIEFSNKDESRDLTITGGYAQLKVKVRRLKKSSDIQEYGTTIKDDELRFTFKDITSKITINDGEAKNKNSNVIMPKGSNMEFLVYDGRKPKIGSAYIYPSSLGGKVGMSCEGLTNGKAVCTSSEDGKLKIYNSASQKIEELTVNNNTNVFDAYNDQDNYNQGYKFTALETIAGTQGGPSLTKGDNYEIKYVDKNDGKAWALVKKDGTR